MNIWVIGKILMKLNYPEKEELYSKLNLEDITDADYMYPKRICKDFEIKNWGNTMIYILRLT